jgi:uncharacterized lipoprotein
MRLATPLVLLALLAVLAGCGSSGETTETGAAPAPVETTAQVRAAWERTPGCQRPQGASRWGCSVGGYRCQGVVSDRGWSISCARPGRSVHFTVRP